MLGRIGVESAEVRLPEHLQDLDGLIIPGGESTTIGKLATAYHLMEPLREFGRQKAIWGTCAGAIFLSKDARRDQPLLGLMDIQVERNAFGRQVDSFEVDLDIPELDHVGPDGANTQVRPYVAGLEEAKVRPYHAVFIRAPLIEAVQPPAQVLAQLPDGRIVAARQGRLLATSFHPELTLDERFHRYFVDLAK